MIPSINIKSIQNNILKILFLLSFFQSYILSSSQVYPVQLSTQLLPPYSGYLPDYGDPTNEKLKCIVMLNDFSVTHRDVKLEISITGNGFNIKTNPTFFPTPITIYPGIPEIISGIDLAPYLETQNLNFTGINVNDYEQRRVLPEGNYSICIKVIDYYQPDYTILSNESCTQAWFFLADPPYLNLPLCGSTQTPTQPQNIFFQWTPMNLSSPNSVMNTEYVFELFEVRPASIPPNDIVLTTAPIFSYTTSNTFYNYGIVDPVLYTGMQYVWRVRAVDLSGRDYFKNEGYSQICTFTYGNPQNAFSENAFTLTLNGQASTHRQIKWWWNNIANFTEYKLQIRKTGTQNWFDYFSSTSEIKISPLEPSTSYEARVMGMGGNIESEWSNTVTVTTNPPPTIVCNDQNIPVNALSAQPLLTTHQGMILQIGQFEMFVTSISPFGNSPGFYSGFGYVKFYGKKIGVQYDNVYINDNLEITIGNVVALSQGLDAWVNDWILDEAKEDAVTIDGIIDTVYINDDSTITVITETGDTTVIPFPDNDHPVVINDDAGNQYIVHQDGTIEHTTYLEFSSDALEATEKNQIVFEKSIDQQYGFDAFSQPPWHEDYEVIQLSDSSNYFIANKSLAKNTDDVVRAKVISDIYSTNEISFQNGTGETLSHTVIDNTHVEITLPTSNESYSVYAMVGAQKLGKLNVRVYEPENKKVVLVALGNQTLPNVTDVENELNSIYKTGVVRWEVSFGNAITLNNWDENANGKIDLDDYSLLNKYSDEMDNIRHAFNEETDDDAYILFIVPGFGDETVDGYMPYGRKFGFIKAGANLKTYAHELGHGAFGLQHTFPDIAQGSTNNLMDYGTGNHLASFQWNWMRENHWLENILVSQSPYILSEEEVETTGTQILEELLNIPNPTGIYTPSGYFISTNTAVLNFSDIKYDFISGGLYSFTYEGQSYSALFCKGPNATTLFCCYIKTDALERVKEYYKSLPENSGYSQETISNLQVPYDKFLAYIKDNPAEIFTDFKWSEAGEQVLGNYFNIYGGISGRKCNSSIIQWELNSTDVTSKNLNHFNDSGNFDPPLWGEIKVLTNADIPDKGDGTYDVYYRNIGTVNGNENITEEQEIDEWYCRIVAVFDKGGWGKLFLEKNLSANDITYNSIKNLFQNEKTKLKNITILAEINEELGAEFMNGLPIDNMNEETFAFIHLLVTSTYSYDFSFEQDKEELKILMQAKINRFNTQITNLNATNYADVVCAIVKGMSPEELMLLDIYTRIRSLHIISNTTMRGSVNFFGNDEEGNALKLITNIHEDQYSEFHRKLINEKVQGNSLLFALDKGFNDTELVAGDGNYGKFHKTLIQQTISYTQNLDPQNLIKKNIRGSILNFGIGESCYFDIKNSSLNSNGDLQINYGKTCTISGSVANYFTQLGAALEGDIHTVFEIENDFNEEEFTYHPFNNWVIIIPNKNYSDLGLTKGDPVLFPAIGAHFLFQEKSNANSRQAFRIVLNTVSIAAGGAGLAATSGLYKVLSVIDIASSGIDITLDVFDEDLKSLIGEEKYNTLRTATGITQLAGLGGMGLLKTIQVLDNLPALTNKLSTLDVNVHALPTRTKNVLSEVYRVFGVSVDEIADDLSTAWKTGWNKERVLEIPKGSRPDPSEYLEASYIEEHISKFNEGVTKFSASPPTSTVGPPGGTFVMPKTDADNIIQAANGDVRELENLLGLTEGSLGLNPIRIDALNPSGLRMPTGNELGANSFWVPGGKTSGGIFEATVDQMQQGSYIVTQIW